MGLFGGDNNDKTVQDYNDKILKKELDDSIPDKFSNIKSSISSIWDDSSSLWSKALDDPDKFLDQISKSNENKDKDVWENFVVNATDAVGSLFDVMGLPGGYGNPNRIRHLMDDPFTAEELVKQGVTGLYNYRTPTDSQFLECQKVRGLSVWNSKGWWRCLFPESAIVERLQGNKDQLSSILTKEKVESDKDHKYGLFFPEYNGYMNWRVHMNELAMKKKQDEKAKQESKQDVFTMRAPEDYMLDSSSLLKDDAKEKNVIGTSQFVTFNYTPEGQEEVKKVKTYYDNGTVLIKSEKTTSPKDGTKPRVESSEKVIDVKDDK